MRLVFLVALFSLLHCGSGWPVGVANTQLLVGRAENSHPNATANGTAVDADPSWVAAPKVRGTWQLIVGCLTTLSLCAWTAYHPNVCQESGMVRKLWRRFTWMMAAVVGPEAVLHCAWEQRWMASRLREKINRLGGRAVDGFEPPPRKEDEYVLTRCSSAPTFLSQSSTLHDDRCSIYSSRSDVVARQPSKGEDHDAQSPFMRFSFEEPAISKPHHDGFSQQPPQDTSSPLFTPWTLQQAFFAVCGGLAVSTGSFWHSPAMTLTPRGVLELTRAGLLPSVTDDEVTEKSKANTAAKVMVCIQASWFLVQAVARLAQKLPLTLLEVHVLAHVLCALAMYFCWVDKPYDAETPIVIADEKVKDMVALFVLDAAPRTGSTSDEIDLQDRLLRPISMAEIQERHMPRRWARDSSTKVPRLMFKLELPADDDGSGTEEIMEDLIQVEREPPSPEQVARMQEHHKRANRGLDYLRNRYFQVVACRGDSEMPREPRLCFRQRGVGRRFVVDQRSNRRIEGKIDIDENTKIRSILNFGVISAGYGAIHLCAWNEHFPSTVECWMWRVAALCMVSFPFAGAAFLRGFTLWSKITPQKDRWKRARWQYFFVKIALGIVAFVVLGPIFLVTFAAMAGWCYGRLFMLIEAAFMSLRSPPLNTYRIPEWSAYWPHAG